MNVKVTQLQGLVNVSGLAFQAAQAEMAAVLNRETDLRRNFAALTESKSTQAKAVRQSDEAALVAGADIRWHHWVDQRRATINTELAQVIVLKENCHVRLKLAFGRDQAAQALLRRAKNAERVAKRRRADYAS